MHLPDQQAKRSETMTDHADAMEILNATSRTFYIPIVRLPPGLQEAVASAYLCMRAIDEVEDHPTLHRKTKVEVLQVMGRTLQACFTAEDVAAALRPYRNVLPEVSSRLGEWALYASPAIAPRIWDATSAMANRMALWVECDWRIEGEPDLDRYTFSVAGTVGLMLSDLWAWYDGTQTDRSYAIGFGRGLQAVNILRNRADDVARGVDFFPPGWNFKTMEHYALRNLALADAYTASLPPGPALDFCRIPLALARATIEALGRGQEKLSRSDVMNVIAAATAD
jgi:farnesyl-diphosphate farnesyltransferase